MLFLDHIISRKECEDATHKICDCLEDLARKMREDEIPLQNHAVIEGLRKHPDDCPGSKNMLLHALRKNSNQMHRNDLKPSEDWYLAQIFFSH